MSQTRDQQRFTNSEVAADWHESMVPQRIMWPSIAHTNGQLSSLVLKRAMSTFFKHFSMEAVFSCIYSMPVWRKISTCTCKKSGHGPF